MNLANISKKLTAFVYKKKPNNKRLLSSLPSRLTYRDYVPLE